jgi:tight adherence protein C
VAHQRILGVAGLVVVGLAVPPAAVVLGAVWVAQGPLGRRRRARREERSVAGTLPDAVDLLLLATSAGLSLPVAHPLVAHHAPAPVGPALTRADAAARAGLPRADALEAALAPLGSRAHALAHVLGDHLRYGTPLSAGLERAGLELRLDRRRQAEQRARRVPVRLLGPLVLCVLPAFALLTVVPLLAASLQALPT